MNKEAALLIDFPETTGKPLRKRTRTKKEPPTGIKEKFVQERLAKVVGIEAQTENQAAALDLFKKRQVVVLRGSSGSGKTYLACLHAANSYLKGTFKRIVIIRPYESLARSIGLRPGDGNDKMRPLMQSMLQTLEIVFGNQLDAKIACGNIVMEALEDCRGRSYKDSVVIVDEAQNTDKHTMKALLTRLEETSQMILCGDGKQKDIKQESGLDWIVDLMARIKKEKPAYLDQEDMDCAYNNFGVVTFTNEDIVRSGFTKLMVKVFDNE